MRMLSREKQGLQTFSSLISRACSKGIGCSFQRRDAETQRKKVSERVLPVRLLAMWILCSFIAALALFLLYCAIEGSREFLGDGDPWPPDGR
jgi:hypothetical protein